MDANNKTVTRKWNDWNFIVVQKYSGSDLLGVTAKVVDMPHHCTFFFSNAIYKNAVKLFVYYLLVSDMLQEYCS